MGMKQIIHVERDIIFSIIPLGNYCKLNLVNVNTHIVEPCNQWKEQIRAPDNGR
jgi:hypothetical protein